MLIIADQPVTQVEELKVPQRSVSLLPHTGIDIHSELRELGAQITNFGKGGDAFASAYLVIGGKIF